MFENLFDIINVPLGYLIKFCYLVIPNYVLALFLFALVVKIIFFPFGIKQQKNMVKQASLRPKEMAIRKRYAGRTDAATQQKLNADIMDLYQKENYNMMGGCLPLLIQFPLLYAVYAVVTNPLKYICGFSSSVIASIGSRIHELYAAAAFTTDGLSTTVINKLTSYANAVSQGKTPADTLTGIEKASVLRTIGLEHFEGILPEGFRLKDIPSFELFGIDFGMTPSFQELSVLLLIPVVTFLVVFFSMRLTRKMSYQPQSEDGNSALSGKIMDFTMPLISVWISFTVPAVVGMYWIYQNLLGTVQQFILMKMYPLPVFTEEEIRAIEKEMNGNIRKEKKKVRSLHRIDEEDLAAEAEAEKSASSDDAAQPQKGTPALKKQPEKPDSPVAGMITPASLKDESDKKKQKPAKINPEDDSESENNNDNENE